MPYPVLTVPPGAVAVAEVDTGAEPSRPERHCLACAQAAEERICESCRARIRGEALEHKLEDERAGRQ